VLTAACFCGTELAGPDRERQVSSAVAHFAASHSELALSATQLRNWLERSEQLTGPAARLESLGSVEVVDIGPEHVEDVLAFFDHDAFADNPDWASCYCLAHHVAGGESGAEWPTRTWQENRDELAARIRSGRTTGTLAYVDGRLAGWCNASVRAEYPEDRTGADDDTTGMVACFVIAPPYRHHGVSRLLLERAVARFAERGLSTVEGHPSIDPKSEASAYHGPLPLFLAAGFEPAGPDGTPVVVRRRL
jgi:GNAT superfamily N-acetyltransferase